MEAEYIYLDGHATTPIDPRVREAMVPYFEDIFANPGSSHRAGQEARKGVEWARAQVANILDTKTQEVIFTSSATEANNIALQGLITGEQEGFNEQPHVITGAIEHSSVLEPLRSLAKRNLITLTELSVSEEGQISLDELTQALTPQTVCVSIMYANNEIGTIQSISEISRIIKEWRREQETPYPYIHTDAVQAGYFLDCNVSILGVDMLSLSGHKLYGPKGVGALYVREDISLTPLYFGGDQEYKLRPGTENVPAIVGMGAAISRLSSKEHAQEKAHITEMRDYTHHRLQDRDFPVIFNGAPEARLPNNVHFSIPGVFAGDLIMYLDLQGIAVSGGSACHSGAWKPSHVMETITQDDRRIQSAIRIGLLKDTSSQDIDTFIEKLQAFVSF